MIHAISATVVIAIISAVIAFANFAYPIAKDAAKSYRRKVKYSKALEVNYARLKSKLKELYALFDDLNGCHGSTRFKAVIKEWSSRTLELKQEVEDLLSVCKSQSLQDPGKIFERAKVSEIMVEKYQEIKAHLQEGIVLS